MKAVAKALESRFRQALDAGRLSQVHYMFKCKSSQYITVVSCLSVGLHAMHKFIPLLLNLTCIVQHRYVSKCFDHFNSFAYFWPKIQY